MGLLRCALLPELFPRIGVRRIGRPLDDRQPGCVLGAAGLRLGARVRRRPSLPEEEGWGGLLQNARAQGQGGSGVEATVLPWRKAVPRAGIEQAADRGPLALACGRDLGWLAAPCPRVRARAPRRPTGCSANPQEGCLRVRCASTLRPRLWPPRLPRRLIKMSRAEGRLLPAQAQVLEPRGAREDVVEAPAAVVKQWRQQGRPPAGAAAPGLAGSLLKAWGQGGCLRRGQGGWAAWRLLVSRTWEPIAAAGPDPRRAGLLGHA